MLAPLNEKDKEGLIPSCIRRPSESNEAEQFRVAEGHAWAFSDSATC